jgi:putative hydrolase of the HAD superfamily
MKISLVCFDIGGVLVRISQSWQEAALRAEVQLGVPPEPLLLLSNSDALNRHQADLTDYVAYTHELGHELGCSPQDADLIHRSILQVEYPGIPELVRQVELAGFQTACLSNTNEIHWSELTNPHKFPTVASLGHLCASHHFRLGKPDPAIYQAFEQRVAMTSEQILFFDDNANNVEAAIAKGWAAFVIDPHGSPATQMREHFRQFNMLD